MPVWIWRPVPNKMTILMPLDILPLLAVSLGQIADAPAGLTVYGPMGIICIWLMVRTERDRKDAQAREDVMRNDNAKLREEIRGIVHQMKGLNRNLLYVTATHGPEGLRQVASRELEKYNSEPPPVG